MIRVSNQEGARGSLQICEEVKIRQPGCIKERMCIQGDEKNGQGKWEEEKKK